MSAVAAVTNDVPIKVEDGPIEIEDAISKKSQQLKMKKRTKKKTMKQRREEEARRKAVSNRIDVYIGSRIKCILHWCRN
jgi:hypothetical protein